MEADKLALVIDIGTQSMRASFVNKSGEIVALCRTFYGDKYISEKEGYFEQEPDFFFDTLITLLNKLFSTNHGLVKDILAMTITCFRDTAVLLDENYNPLRKMILWFDQRLARPKKKLPLYKRLILNLVKMRDTVEYNRNKSSSIWIKENEPNIFKKIKFYVSLSCYLYYKLTGNLTDSASSFTGHYPLNYKTKKWYKSYFPLKNVFDIPKELMPELVTPGTTIGYINNNLKRFLKIDRDIEVIASGSDKSAETIGSGALSNSVATISLGTSSTVSVISTKYHEPVQFLPAYPSIVFNHYDLEVQIYRGFSMLKWFVGEFCSEEKNIAKEKGIAIEDYLNDIIKNIPAGSEGLVLHPYWGSSLKRADVRGSILGFNDVHTKYHIYRAIIEGILFALKEGLLSIEASMGKKVSELRVSGGGAHSDIVAHMLADIFNLRVYRSSTVESTTLGGAILIFVAKDIYENFNIAVKTMVNLVSEFKPDKKNQEIYSELFNEVYLHLYPTLGKINRKIKKFQAK